MQYGLQASGSTYEETLAWARWAEDQELSGFAIPDHFLRGGVAEPALDALALIAGLARDTESIELFLMVSPITWRHPAVLAKTYATVAEMSGGRLTLGVGTGWLEQEHQLFGLPFPDTTTRFEMLEEALQYLRASFSEPPESFTGTHYAFDAFDVRPRPELKLLVGGTGILKTPTLAGRYCDELNAYPAPEADYSTKVKVAREAAIEAGRDPEELLISSSGVLVAGDTDAEYHERLERFAAMIDSPLDEVEAGLRRRNSPRGTWTEVRDTLAGMQRAGMQRFWIQAFGDSPDEVGRALERLRE
jgi:alkanesulfonate monooxygenase SsuD/methylene tetrahydromethanopterin reductase-like flavin-dependent oxidoreductase (luciferase family)